ncbi:hypothetical protein TNIN_364761 [Trichonephila inaurata madagascariensis]|uniref:Uncharacterized protein n=1 Tax=Trichonephila inaurata madagascariensis TaxID=2747483 RepID=A0A8X6YBY1_9ARAC|nr:hypothetical protein TNIN_364761 [Trichonephila inaurata madagascariensis]
MTQCFPLFLLKTHEISKHILSEDTDKSQTSVLNASGGRQEKGHMEKSAEYVIFSLLFRCIRHPLLAQSPAFSRTQELASKFLLLRNDQLRSNIQYF